MWNALLKSIRIIQGGMGIYVCTPFMAQTISRLGGLGTVSSVGAHIVVARLLQQGDVGGHFRRAFNVFPYPRIAEKIYRKYYHAGGIPADTRFKVVPIFTLNSPREIVELSVLANFALVWLAKEGHDFPVSINFMAKLELSILPGIFGAMLAGANFITVGAGMPDQIPPVMGAFLEGREAVYRLTVNGRRAEENSKYALRFNPREFFGEVPTALNLPGFLPIVSGYTLALKLANGDKLARQIAAIIISPENKGGGHKVLPRGNFSFTEDGEPLYGPKDRVDPSAMNDLGYPWYLAGNMSSLEAIEEAMSQGAQGGQFGSIFATSEDSGWMREHRDLMRKLGYRGELRVRTELRFSPTGFGLNVADLPGTLSDPLVYVARKRVCDVSCLASLTTHEGKDVFLCPAELPRKFHFKGGTTETDDYRCLCNALLAAVGLGNPGDPPLFTFAKDHRYLRAIMEHEDDSYTVAQAFEYLQSLMPT